MAASSQADSSGEKTPAPEAQSLDDAGEAATNGEKKDVEVGAAAADQTVYPGPLAAGLLMLAICVGIFLVSLVCHVSHHASALPDLFALVTAHAST
ncbi:Uncharacterized protein TPAR_06656 [Tolypocladium paradoxum]|uniref:Uncharacterized protein n=1 Tax=Tolypocladium paradoxum TaxID=94208 RepID=A0A2S4KSH6_9HYPO|nr:Uncharacterized protein TPAR_06656 [Tolypocladium paradoxum]